MERLKVTDGYSTVQIPQQQSVLCCDYALILSVRPKTQQTGSKESGYCRTKRFISFQFNEDYCQ